MGEPLITRRGDDNITFVQNRIPLKCVVELPGYRQAGTFNMDFAFRDLPLDPRTVRACAVDIHLGAVSAADFGRGMVNTPTDGWRSSVLRTTLDNGSANPDTLVMTGTVDKWSAKHSSGMSTVTIEGRDMRGILLDTPLTNDPARSQWILEDLDLSVPIDQGGAEYSVIRQAKETLGQKRLDFDVARDQVRQTVVQSWGQLDAAKANIDATTAQVQAAEIALNGVREEARVGQRTTLDVLNAQQELVNARVALVTAQRDRVVASYTLLSAVGRLAPEVLGLNVPIYDAQQHYQQVRDSWTGVRTRSEEHTSELQSLS
jgi:outer membrane protein